MKNVLLGASVENKKDGLPRIEHLRSVFYSTSNFRPKLFLSIEPLLEDLGEIDLTDIDWVIVGGKSGSNARTMKKEWVLNIKRQCKDQEAPFFFKQWDVYGEDRVKRSKKLMAI